MAFQIPTGGLGIVEQVRKTVEQFRGRISKGGLLGGLPGGLLPGVTKRGRRTPTTRRTPTRRTPTSRAPPTRRAPTSRVVPHVTKPEKYDFSYSSGKKVGVRGEHYDFSY